MHLFPLSGRSRSPTRNRSFGVFAKSTGRSKYVFLPVPSLDPPVYLYSKYFSDFFNLFLAIGFSVFLSLLLVLPCTSQKSPRMSSCRSVSSCSLPHSLNYVIPPYASSPFCCFLLQPCTSQKISADVMSFGFLLSPTTLSQIRYPTVFQLALLLLSTIQLHQLWLPTSFLACSLLCVACSTSHVSICFGWAQSQFCSIYCITTVVVLEHLRTLTAVICTAYNCSTKFALPSRTSPAYSSFGTTTFIRMYLLIFR